MLVLSRKTEEGIMVGDHILIKILSIEDGKVKLGIEAPHELGIYRLEIFQMIKEENIIATEVNQENILKLQSL